MLFFGLGNSLNTAARDRLLLHYWMLAQYNEYSQHSLAFATIVNIRKSFSRIPT